MASERLSHSVNRAISNRQADTLALFLCFEPTPDIPWARLAMKDPSREFWRGDVALFHQ